MRRTKRDGWKIRVKAKERIWPGMLASDSRYKLLQQHQLNVLAAPNVHQHQMSSASH